MSAKTYVHIYMGFNQKRRRHFIFSLEIPNCVNVTPEFQDSHVIRYISLNCSKSLNCFMTVNGLETPPREIWVLSLCRSQIFTSAFNLKRQDLGPLRYGSKQWTVQIHMKRWNLQEHHRGDLPTIMMFHSFSKCRFRIPKLTLFYLEQEGLS